MKTLGAFFQVYKNKKATEAAMKSFRACYPDSPVLLISDGGSDFTDIAEVYDAKFIMRHNILGVDRGFYNSERTIEAWNRHKMAVEHAQTDYIIILEDDVLVQKRVDFDGFDIKGPTANQMPPKGISEILRNRGCVGSGRFGACGGSVYKSSSFMQVYESAVNYSLEEHDTTFYNPPISSEISDRSICAFDCNMTFHFSRCGFEYEAAEWLAEVHRQPDWRNYPIVHGYKENY